MRAVCALVLLCAFSVSAADKPAKDEGWRDLFDGKTLKGWKMTNFAGGGQVEVRGGRLAIDMGESLSGVTFTNEVPRTNYEIEVIGKKVQGADFFCGLTFPVGTNCCTFVMGGWGGAVVGISSIDQMDASENDTTKFMKFEDKKDYKIHVRVTPEKIMAWIDDEKLVDIPLKDRQIGMRPGEIELSQPFGLATYQTSSEFKTVRIRPLKK